PRFERTLDRMQRIYRSRARLPIYNTEYGYITDPPNHLYRFASPTTAAYYLNWAEYLSWRDPRISSTMQFLLRDPPSYAGGFDTGLLFYGGTPKPTYDAYRLPIYLPVTTTTRGHSLEVWGCVRPAHYATVDSAQTQVARVLFAPGHTQAFRTLSTVTIANPRGYFDVRVTLPSSGSVKLAWTY